MPSSTIEILDFSAGTQPDQTTAIGFSAMALLDPHTNPGVLAVNNKPVQLEGSCTGDPLSIEVYDENGGTPAVFIMDSAADIFENASGTITSRRTLTSTGGYSLKSFNTSLYYSWVSAGTPTLGKLTGDASNAGNYTDSFKTLLATNPTFAEEIMPMEVFAGALYICYGRFVAKLESDETTITNAALTIEKNYFIQCSTIYNDRLVMGTSSGNRTAKEYILLWDGVSDFPETIIEVPKPGATALMNTNNTLYAWIGDSVYYFDGSEFKPAFTIPKTSDGISDFSGSPTQHGAVTMFRERTLFGVSDRGYSIPGVWEYGSRSGEYPNVLSFAYTNKDSDLATGNRCTAVRLIKSGATGEPESGTLYIGFDDNTIHTLTVNSDLYTTGPYLITEVFDLKTPFGRLLKGVRLVPAKNTVVSNSWTVKYRVDDDIDPLDDDASWTTLGTVINSNAGDILYGIYKRPKRIQFRVDFTTTGVLPDSRLQSIYIY